MTKIKLSLRLRGDLPTLVETNELLGIEASNYYKKGELVGPRKNRVQKSDVWILGLTPDLNHDSSASDIEDRFLKAVDKLDHVLPRICNIDSSSYDFTSEINVSIVQDASQGSFSFPHKLLQVIATVDIPIALSVIAV